MPQPIFIENEILIAAEPAAVWEALIQPSQTVQYMYGCEIVCDWQPGSPLLWKGAADGVIYVKGHLVAFEPEKTFSFTVFDPQGPYADIPANYLTATYTLTPEGGATRLRVTQGDYAIVAEGAQRYEDSHSQGGWGAVLEGIRQLVEVPVS
ncbi:MAG: SRPBCC domain-containing protein [Bacteroidia bacterium]|nr:SRPBCC domain-containing protein [Bacteroidia bacterium]